MNRLIEFVKRINIESPVEENVSLANYTTFKTGGPAEIFIRAQNQLDIIEIYKMSITKNVPLFILGEGANLLVSDKGIPGITLYTGDLKNLSIIGNTLIAEAGISINSLCEYALNYSLSGLEFIYGMPGTLGGALWMNARCYGSEISSNLVWVEYINQSGEINRIEYSPKDWDYKLSPFQKMNSIILRACFKLVEKNKQEIKNQMDINYLDRKNKGHFNYPCAGSVFKNNRIFGAPTGKIIEDAGLKGLKYGNAQIADFHGNIIVNLGDAKSQDIDYLIKKIEQTVYDKFNFKLEPEVIYAGDWS